MRRSHTTTRGRLGERMLSLGLLVFSRHSIHLPLPLESAIGVQLDSHPFAGVGARAIRVFHCDTCQDGTSVGSHCCAEKAVVCTCPSLNDGHI